ncbi:MAG: sigma-70 family RNA polymerase sigma factor [Anaerolineales bacterium]|nr:sigma-70 family RNA polymerase sigma factor [Anaerolineales bacterium]
MPAEPDLLTALRAGDPAALAALFEARADQLYRLALSLLRDPAEAEDVVQETFLKALTRLEQFEGRARLDTWLYRVAYNASLDRLRRRVPEPLPEDEPEAEGGPLPQVIVEWSLTPENRLLDAEARAMLETAIQALPATLRPVFLLRDIEGLSGEETAEALGLNAGVVKVRLHRARLALRERLSAYFGERLAQTGA